MKTKSLLIISAILLSWGLYGCCTTKTQEYHGKTYVPVIKSFDEIRNGVKVESPRDLKYPGKIYIYGQYLFINEKTEGIHIIDNANPSAPVFLTFLAVPGNGDIAVKDEILYADSYVDLLAFDIKNPTQPNLVKRVQSIFPEPFGQNTYYVEPEKGIITGWIEKDTVYKYTTNDCDDYSVTPVDRGWENGDIAMDGSGGKTTGPGGATGKGGSMARFTIYRNYLYSVDNTNLQTFDISIPENPRAWNKINIGWNIETVFPYKDKLFIGSQTGMFIYDNSTPWNPTYLSQFSHARGCDPVVADDNYAYVTLRTGTACAGNLNQLDILDISSITNPQLIKSYPMLEPAGIGLDGKTLFLCDGRSGLKVFDVKNPNDIQLLDWESDIKTYDVIPLGHILIMIGDDGLYQWDYTNPSDMKLLSKILIKK